MTDFEAAQVKEMRLNGMGYRAIAEALGLSRDIVRNHCKAKGMGGYVAATVKNLKEYLCRAYLRPRTLTGWHGDSSA